MPHELLAVRREKPSEEAARLEVGVVVPVASTYAAAALVLAISAEAAATRVSFTRVVSPNEYASLTVKVTPRARCTIKVVYDTVVSRAKGLGAKRGGLITWRWKVGSNTNPGRWPVTVDCGRSGKLTLRLRVLRD